MGILQLSGQYVIGRGQDVPASELVTVGAERLGKVAARGPRPPGAPLSRDEPLAASASALRSLARSANGRRQGHGPALDAEGVPALPCRRLNRPAAERPQSSSLLE